MIVNGGGQKSKAVAHYRAGNPIKHCGVCQNYIGKACKVVAGPINPYMISDDYVPFSPNPLKEKGITYTLQGNIVKPGPARVAPGGGGSALLSVGYTGNKLLG